PYTVRLYAFHRIPGTRPAFSVAVCVPKGSNGPSGGRVYSVTVKPGPEAAAFATRDGLTLRSTYAQVVAALGPPDQTRNQTATDSIALIYRSGSRSLTCGFNASKTAIDYIAIEEPASNVCG
ncbi:MAG: hypothetical protein P8Y13_14885, partial [Deinococcales bacterium]